MPAFASIRPIHAVDHIDAAEALLEQHRLELATRPDIMSLNPLRELYAAFKANGTELSLGAFDEEGALVGYSVNVLTPNAHYAHLLMCQNDLLYVRPDLRGSLGLRLIKATERAAKNHGADIVLWHAKERTPFAELLPRLGYGVQDIIFSKVLD